MSAGLGMQSAAFVVGPRDGADHALMQLSQDIGFSDVARYEGPDRAMAQSRLTPVCFFLVASSAPKSLISEFVTEIRHHPDRSLRFSPLMYLTEDPSPRNIQFCVRAGFDDIIAPPFAPARLRARLMSHIGVSRFYFETATYFGPDRRQPGGAPQSQPDKRGSGQFLCFEIRRDFVSGTRILRQFTDRTDPTPPASEAEAHLI